MKLLILLLLFAAPLATPLSAQTRAPDDAERMYQEVGEQLFCICGCRENLLTCSHNVCSSKDAERAFLRELVRDPKLSAGQVKQEMVKRFGPEVLQVPENSSLYPVLLISLAVLATAFGFGYWTITRKRTSAEESADETAPLPANDSTLDSRIANELKEMDQP